jgi:hypothetical protein
VADALRQCALSPDAVLDAAITLFGPESTVDKASVLQQLVFSMGNDEDAKIQKISFHIHTTSFTLTQGLPKQESQSLTLSHIAGVFMLDLVRQGWLSALASPQVEHVSSH